MTDEELIAAMRDLSAGPSSYLQDVGNAAADRIEALVKARREDALELLAAHGQAQDAYEAQLKAEARAERLEAALQEIAAEASVPVYTWKNGINFKKMYEGWRKIAAARIDIARAALKGADHEN